MSNCTVCYAAFHVGNGGTTATLGGAVLAALVYYLLVFAKRA